MSDKNAASVNLLLGFEGSNNSTTFTDESQAARTVTPSGNAKITTSIFKYGTSCGVFDGTGDFLTVAHNAVLSVSNGDLTIECWFMLNSINTIKTIISKRPSSSAAEYAIYVNASNLLQMNAFGASGTAVISATGTTVLGTGVWHHMAASRVSNAWKIFLDGVLEASGTETGSPQGNTSNVVIGRDGAFSTARDFNGWMDEFRFTSGVGRYTANFTPPRGPYDRKKNTGNHANRAANVVNQT